MIGELAFKGFCKHAASGLPVQALFITPDAPSRNQQGADMVCGAVDLNLPAIWRSNIRAYDIGPATAYLRIAHPYLDRELRGHEWHFIHGLEYLDAFEHGAAIRANLEMMVRS